VRPGSARAASRSRSARSARTCSSSRDPADTAQIIADQNPQYRILCNLVDPLRGPAPVEQLRELLDTQGLPYFRSFIRRYVAHPQSQLDGLPVTAYRGDRSWRAAVDDIRRVQVELLIELAA
jgi:chromosome partitioning protein